MLLNGVSVISGGINEMLKMMEGIGWFRSFYTILLHVGVVKVV